MRSESRYLPPDLLAGRNVLIAGGTGNVGRRLVAEFLDAGARVVVPSRSREKIDALRASLDDDPGERLITLEGDPGAPSLAVRMRDEILHRSRPLDAVVASLGGFVPAPSVLDAPLADLQRALDGYLLAHFRVARALMPALEGKGGSYTFINGPLAFDPMFPGSGLVSIATAAQAMLARVVMEEKATADIRVNELVLYTSFGWAEKDKRGTGVVTQDDVARYAACLASELGAGVRGETIHLSSLEPLDRLLLRDHLELNR